MGLFDMLRGIKRPTSGTPLAPRRTLEQRLLGLNHERVPFEVAPSDASDLVVRWKILDDTWREIFARAGTQKTHIIYLRLDEASHEARALEEAATVVWEAGAARLSLSMERTRNRAVVAREYSTAYAYTGVNPRNVGQIFNYRFELAEMKEPLIAVITGAGWSYVPVTSQRRVRKGR